MYHYPLYLLLLGAALVQLHAPAVFGQRECLRGSFLKDGACELCPIGTYRILSFSEVDRCTKCKPGTYQPHRGMGSKHMCRPCPRGTFSAERGASSCMPCPHGMISDLGATFCLSCGPGTRPAPYDYNVGRPKQRCQECPVNTYSNSSLSTECTPCPEGTSARKGAKSLSDCVMCPAGKQPSMYERTGCSPCYAGTFKAHRGVAFCQDCPSGYTQTLRGKRSCDVCPAGTRSHRTDEPCRACPANAIRPSVGNSLCRKDGTPCPTWSYATPDGACRQCPPNTVVSDDNTTCLQCPVGARSPGGGARNCIKCPPDQIGNHFGTDCKCTEGNFVSSSGTCEKCAAGTFTNKEYVGGLKTECEPCSFYGKVSTKEGSTSCTACPEFRVPNAQSSKCIRCPPGQTTGVPLYEGDEMKCVNITTGCPPGFRVNDFGGPCGRVTCQPGTSADLVGITCLPCDPGYALLGMTGTRGRLVCKKCPTGWVSEGGVISECTKCADGMVSDPVDEGTCSCRATGYGKTADGKCILCKRGFFSEFPESACHKCPRGRFTMKRGSYYCMKCKRGTFKAVAGPGMCMKCKDGLLPNRHTGATGCVSM